MRLILVNANKKPNGEATINATIVIIKAVGTPDKATKNVSTKNSRLKLPCTRVPPYVDFNDCFPLLNPFSNFKNTCSITIEIIQ